MKQSFQGLSKIAWNAIAQIKDAVARCPFSVTLAVSNQSRYPVWRQEPGCLTHRHRRLLTQKLIFSPAYYNKVGTNGIALKFHIISGGLYPPLFTEQSLYFYIWNSDEIINPMEFANKHKLWENRDFIWQPVFTDIYLCLRKGKFCVTIAMVNWI
jgi:hypothetical protein